MYPSMVVLHGIFLGTFLCLTPQTDQLSCLSELSRCSTIIMSGTVYPVCSNDVHIVNTPHCSCIPCALPNCDKKMVLPTLGMSKQLLWRSKVNVAPRYFLERADQPDHYFIGNTHSNNKHLSKEAGRVKAAFFI